jgi:methionine synthase II (cobalamin-independent)
MLDCCIGSILCLGSVLHPVIVIARIHEAAKYIPLDRLCLSPQCGFASCEIGNKLTEEQQWAKLALVKEIAEEVWK